MILGISLNIDLQIIDNQIHIKRSTTNVNNNAFEVRDDGIYMDDRIVADGEGFVNQAAGIIRIGYFSPYDTPVSGFTEGASGRVSANNVVHRVFTAKDSSGTTYENFREVDCFLPGDMLRVPRENGQYEYRLITNTTATDRATAYCMNNEIKSYIVLGTW